MAMEDTYNEGLTDGIKQGREEGLKEGREEGREEGLKEGREEGREEGLKEGREEGREEGRVEGRKEGHEEGRKEGRIEALVRSIRSLMKRHGQTADESMDDLSIIGEERDACIKYMLAHQAG